MPWFEALLLNAAPGLRPGLGGGIGKGARGPVQFLFLSPADDFVNSPGPSQTAPHSIRVRSLSELVRISALRDFAARQAESSAQLPLRLIGQFRKVGVFKTLAPVRHRG